MSKAVFDTRFFIEHFYSSDKKILTRTKDLLTATKKKHLSAVVIHEVFKITLETEGKETAYLRANLMEKDFKIIVVDSKIAKLSAKLRHKYRAPMADCMVAATALDLKTVVISDDPHFKIMKEIKTKWIM